MIELQHKKISLWQWDINQTVTVDFDAVQMHYRVDEKNAIAVPIEDGVAKIPDILLQKAEPLVCYAYDGNSTLRTAVFAVIPRPKPPNYIYTEPEQKQWEKLDERINALEDNMTVAIKLGHALQRDDDGAIAVKMASKVEEDKTLPISSADVDIIVGNIDILLERI